MPAPSKNKEKYCASVFTSLPTIIENYNLSRSKIDSWLNNESHDDDEPESTVGVEPVDVNMVATALPSSSLNLSNNCETSERSEELKSTLFTGFLPSSHSCIDGPIDSVTNPQSISQLFTESWQSFTRLCQGGVQSQCIPTETSPDSSVSDGRGSHATMLTHHLYKMIIILCLLTVHFPSASCEHERVKWSCDLSHCDPRWCWSPAAAVFQCSNTSGVHMLDSAAGILVQMAVFRPNSTCMPDMLLVSLAGLCHSPVNQLEAPLSQSEISCLPLCLPELSGLLLQPPNTSCLVLETSRYPPDVSLVPAAWCFYPTTVNRLNATREICRVCLIFPPEAFLARVTWHYCSTTHEPVNPPNSSCHVLETCCCWIYPDMSLAQPSYISTCQPVTSLCLEQHAHHCWFCTVTGMNSPSAMNRTEAYMQGVNTPSQPEQGGVCPLVSLELPMLLNSLAVLVVCVLIKRRHPHNDAGEAEEPEEMEVEPELEEVEPEPEEVELEFKPVEESSEPLPSSTKCVYSIVSRSLVLSLIDHRQQDLQSHPHNFDQSSTDDNTVFPSAFSPPSSVEHVDDPVSVSVATIPARVKAREVAMLDGKQLDEIVAPYKAPLLVDVVISAPSYIPPTAVVRPRLVYDVINELPHEDRMPLAELSHEDESDGQRRRFHSQDLYNTSESESSEGADIARPSKVTSDGHKASTSLCKMVVREECGGSPSTSDGSIPLCSPNPPPDTNMIYMPPCTLDEVVAETGVSFPDGHGLWVCGCITGPAAIADDIKFYPVVDPPAEIEGPEGGPFSCPFDHVDLWIKPFQAQC